MPTPINAQKLGQLIFDMNPYTTTPNFGNLEDLEMEIDEQSASYWAFKSESYRVKRTLRIEYCVKKTVGGVDYMITDYLLIGYEGAGGY